MARIADPKKMNNIKKAVMECIVDYGYSGVSIALICKKAGVSPGYLYRYYNSKEELVEELVDSEMSTIIDNFISDINSSATMYEAGYKIIRKLFMSANKKPMLAKFAASVVIKSNVTTTEVLTVSFTIPFSYLSFSLELENNKKFTEKDVKRIAEICINALK